MERFSISEVIEQAVQTEGLGYEFYTAMAERFKKNEGLRKLFEMLALKELHHKKVFSELKEKAESKEPANPEEVSQYLRAIVESEFFLDKEKSISSLEHVKTAADAIRFALGFEKETLLYFYSLRDVLKEKEIVDEIINEERSHIVWLSEFKKTINQ